MGTTHFTSIPDMMNGLKVGSGTTLTKVVRGTIAVDLASVANAAVTEVTLTITGAATGDTVIMTPPTAGMTAGLIAGDARVSAADTVKLRVANLSGGTLDEASATWSYCLIRS
jgi:hypothetical protein